MSASSWHRFSLIRLIAFVLMGLALQSCSTVPTPNPGLDINLANIQFDSSTAFETTATVTLRLSNESPDPIKIRGAVHEITLNDVKLGKIISGEELELPPFSEQLQITSMKVSHLRIITRIQKLANTKVFDYQLSSKVYLNEPRTRIRLRKTETLDLR